jgi:alkylation response protein AidB-like acyl-CoA dehydrogenase
MRLGSSSEVDAFRQHARDFIAQYAPPLRALGGNRAPAKDDLPAMRSWTGQMFAGGFLGSDWPVEYGGSAHAEPFRDEVFSEELVNAGAPGPIGAAYLASGALLNFGSKEQQRRYLPKIRSGEHLWCQLFSEPEAGSDLAGLRTTAVLESDCYRLNGQKIWTTNAQNADMGYLLARTSNDSKHGGITAFVLDMSLRGIDVRPLREITGDADFNEVFFTDVSIPLDCVLGRPGEGWTVATTSLVTERRINRGLSGRMTRRLSDLVTLFGSTAEDNASCTELGRVIADVEAARWLQFLSAARRNEALSDAADAPVVKIFSSETNARMVSLALEVEAQRGLLDEDDTEAVDGGSWQDDFLYSRTYTIAGGSNEILRNMIAERALGLPKN